MERYQRNVERTVKRWQTAMDLGFISIYNHFSDLESKNIAEVVTNWEYREAGIVWYRNQVVNLSQEELDAAAVHELGHIIVAPMSDHLPTRHHKLEEFVVESIAKAIMGVHNATVQNRSNKR